MAQGSMEKVLEVLLEGNRRFARGHPKHPRRDAARRAAVIGGQHPFAVVLSCSDSRVPPEIIFDQGIGDLFVVRVAGNLIDELGLASIEYAAEHLSVALVVVLGHARCGAVETAVSGGVTRGRLGRLTAALRPAVERGRGAGRDVVEEAVRENIRAVVHALRSAEPILKPLVAAGKLAIVGAYYDLASGVIEIVG
jgi:carbonic anhydrase